LCILGIPKNHVPSLTVGPYYSQLGTFFFVSSEYMIKKYNKHVTDAVFNAESKSVVCLCWSCFMVDLSVAMSSHLL